MHLWEYRLLDVGEARSRVGFGHNAFLVYGHNFNDYIRTIFNLVKVGNWACVLFSWKRKKGKISQNIYDEKYLSVPCYYASVINHVAANLLCALSLYTVTAISVDRLLALLLRLRYRQVITLKRTCLSVIVIWIMCVFGTSSYFWSHSFTSWWVLIGTGLCQFTSIFSYTKIFCTLRHNQIHIQHHGFLRQPSQATPLNIPRYRKAVTSALWVQVTMTFCYLPYRIVEILRPKIGLSSSLYLSIQFTANLVLFKNSSLNPLLYCWKIREVRQAVKDTVRQFFCPQN